MVSLGKLFKSFRIGTCGKENNDLLSQLENGLSYQDDEQENDLPVQVADLEIPSVNKQPSNSEDGISVQASLVDKIRRESELQVEEDVYEDDIDETLGQYDSDNDRPMTIPDDDDEYSDLD